MTHRWAHTRHADWDGFVTVIVDMTPVVDQAGPARLLDVVLGRSTAALTGWLQQQNPQFRPGVEVVAMDEFGGYQNAATITVPDAILVMDPFHVVALAGTKLDRCRQSLQQDTTGHRGRTGDRLYRSRRTLRTRLELMTTRQRARFEAVFSDDAHVAVEVTWQAYQQIIAAYAEPDPRHGRARLATLIDTLRAGLPAGLDELATLGRTLHRRRTAVLPTSRTAHRTGRPKPSTAASSRRRAWRAGGARGADGCGRG